MLVSAAFASAQDDAEPDLDALQDRLRETPIISNTSTDAVREIFQHGQTLGLRPDVFTKIGDSDTTSGDFLQPFGIQNARTCTLGDYDHLSESIAYFSATRPRPNIRNSFVNPSAAAANGLSSSGAFDSFWARDEDCRGGESPLACEYRLVRPAAAVIMLGRMDVIYFDEAIYREGMTDLIEFSMESGVIPILTTFIVLPDNDDWADSIVFNNTLVDLAEEYEIPLINLWAAAEDLPQHGIGPDYTHLSHAVGSFCDFTGAQERYGGTLRNFLTLQTLDELRQSTLNPED